MTDKPMSEREKRIRERAVKLAGFRGTPEEIDKQAKEHDLVHRSWINALLNARDKIEKEDNP